MVTYIHIMAPKCALSLGPKSATSLVIFTHLVKRGLSEPQMLSFEHILDPRNKCGYLTHAIKRDIDISVTTSCSLSNVSPAMLARSSSPNQAARSEFVRSQGVSAIPSPSRTGSAFSSFEHQARFITVTLPRLLNPHKVFFTITHFVSILWFTSYSVTFGVLGAQSILTRAHRRSSTYRHLVIYSDPDPTVSGGPPHKHLITGM